MIEIISVKDIKDATPEELANLRRKGLLPAEGTSSGGRNQENIWKTSQPV